MNILIVGNGFDLSHYLPTKYDHFMDVMGAIEEKDTGGKLNNLEVNSLEKWMQVLDDMFEWKKDESSLNYQMNFDELFSKTRDPNFIEKTKELYLTENIEICAKDVLKIQYRLGLNYWYQYFKKHVHEIKTWIDFEQKIQSALALVFKVIKKIHLKFEKYGSIDTTVRNLTKTNSDKEDEKLYLTELEIDQLIKLGLFTVNTNYGEVRESSFGSMADSRKGFISNRWFYVKEKTEYGFSSEKYMSYLNTQLDDFIEIFNLYLELIVSQLSPMNSFSFESKNWVYPDKVYSFNYTNTFQRIHDSVDVDYLHGSHGQSQNIVLGISELEEESLKKIKAYGFTKYHQKLFKDTDYLFLDEYKNKIKLDSRKINKLETDNFYAPPDIDEQRKECIEIAKLNINFSIWGHSLDISDKDYIIDLFSLNDDMDRNVRVTIFYFDKPAKFSLLNNLLAILGKDKVEQWMKNKWLEFKPNPEVKFEVDSNLEEAS